jgi:hypothetical protein
MAGLVRGVHARLSEQKRQAALDKADLQKQAALDKAEILAAINSLFVALRYGTPMPTAATSVGGFASTPIGGGLQAGASAETLFSSSRPTVIHLDTTPTPSPPHRNPLIHLQHPDRSAVNEQTLTGRY